MSWISKAMHSLIFGIRHDEWLSASFPSNKLLLLAAPTIGGIIIGIFFLALSRWRSRPIVDPIEGNALYGGRLSLTDSIIVAVQNLISNGFGASVGLEAGYTQLSSGIASRLGIRLKFRRENLRIIVGCGAAGAIAAAFNAPFAGSFYAFELIIGTYTSVGLAPVAVAAVVATVVARALSGSTVLIGITDTGTITPHEYLPAILLGTLCAILGIVLMKGVAFIEQLARRSSVHPALRPAVGGFAVGLLALATPQVLSAGHGALHLNLEMQSTFAGLLAVFFLKAMASAISIGSGFRGGLFFASLFMGALVGKIFSFPADALTASSLTPSVFAVVGMSSMAAAIIGGPLTMTFLALEITGDFSITALVFAAVISSSVVVRITFGYSFAIWRFHLRGEKIRSAHDIGWIRSLTVEKLMRPDVKKISVSTSAKNFCETFPLGSTHRVILTDDIDRYLGIIFVSEVHSKRYIQNEVKLEEFIKNRSDILYPQMNIRQSAAIFRKTKSNILTVVNNSVDRKVVGQLSENRMLKIYCDELIKRQQSEIDGII